MASLTDTHYKIQGHTVLYIPKEGMNIPPEKAAKDKELVQRLESEYFQFFTQKLRILMCAISIRSEL